MKVKIQWALVGLFVLGFLVRLYRFDNPIADWHSWRQADTSSVSRNFAEKGFDLLHPTYHDLSNVASGLENPHGYRMVEFPIYNVFQAGGYVLFDFLTLEEWGRLVSIVSSLFSALFLYLLVKKHFGEREALFAAAFFLFIPYSIYYSRTILPDTIMVTAILAGIYFFDKWLSFKSNIKEQKSKPQLRNQMFYGLSIIFTAVSFLLKPYALFFTLPMVYLAYSRFGARFITKWQLWLFAILTVIPLVWWRIWITQYPEGIPVSDWLFNGGNVRFQLYYFRWLGYERLIKLILGYSGVIIFALGFLKRKKDDFLFPLTFALSSVLYILIIARGNLQHDYYQILVIPSISIFLARGSSYIMDFKKIPYNFRILFLLVVSLLGFIFSASLVKDYFNVNNWAIVAAGKAADQLLPKDAKVIALYNGDTSFLYQTNRSGWPVFTDSIESLVAKGAEYMIIANPTPNDFSGFGKTYKRVAESQDYLILKLQ